MPGGAAVGLTERVAEMIAGLPRPADRAELAQLLGFFENRLVNLVLTGIPRPFSAMALEDRERYLRSWATSRLGVRRKAFQALKRITTVAHYTATDATGSNPAWAAIGYPGPMGPAPATPKTIVPLTLTADTTLDCDVVVIGSGAGGGVVAGELARAGKSVIVLEKGAYVNEADFSQREDQMLGRLYDAAGLLTTSDLGLILLQGSCLGGGTVVNYTTSFRPPRAVRVQWAKEHALPHYTSPEFTRHLDAVAQRIHVNADHTEPSGRDRIMIRGLERCGWHHGLLPRNVDGCRQDDGCGYCVYGCRHGAKRSTLVTYLQDAHDQGARMVVNADVRRIVRTAGRATGVEAMVRTPGSPRPLQLAVRAKAVVVACGSIHSPALLLRSGLRHSAIGRHLTLHPVTAVVGVMDEPVRPWTGTMQAHFSEQFADLEDGYGFRFETAPIHPSFAALILPWTSGRGHQEQMAQLPHLTVAGILLRDRFGGRVRVDGDGAPIVDYRVSTYDMRHLWRGVEEGARLLESAGAREVGMAHAESLWYRPWDGSGMRAAWLERVRRAGLGSNRAFLASFHQMSSCRMGGNRETSVVNEDNQVWDTPGLFLADASVFPSASGVNPMLTIMGIAHRAAAIVKDKI